MLDQVNALQERLAQRNKQLKSMGLGQELPAQCTQAESLSQSNSKITAPPVALQELLVECTQAESCLNP